MKLRCPVKRCVWGAINSQKDLEKYIDKSGQRFGVDESGPACEVNPTFPCDKTYYEYLGFGLHKGIDIPCVAMTEVYASHSGRITRVSDDTTQGIGVVIWDYIQGIESVYWHLKSHSVFPGDIVQTGQLIAYSNNTGYSKGNHLHFQVNLTNEHGKSGQAIDPLQSFVWDTDMLDKEDVRFLQALEGFHDQAGVDFWGDGTHTLKEYKVARVPDKVKELTNLILI